MSVCMEKMGLFLLSITILKRNAVSSQFNFHHVDCKKLCQLKMPKTFQAENDCLYILSSLTLNH